MEQQHKNGPASELGFRVARLLPHHCNVTTTQSKKVRAHLLNYVKQGNTTFKQKNIQSMFFEAVNSAIIFVNDK